MAFDYSPKSDIRFNMQASATYDVQRLESGTLITLQDVIAEEVPIAMVYNGISHAVMLASPSDLKDFALGFSLSEGILVSASDLYSVEETISENGITLELHIASGSFARLKSTRRSMTGRTGCGLCGAESLDNALRLPQLLAEQNIQDHLTVSAQSIAQGLLQMRQQQLLQTLTGATHACAWVNVKGDVILLREDVGRHNALDKLIGALALKSEIDKSYGFVMTTSRASVEMVQKCIAAGIPMLVAVSAPTGLAIRVAKSYGLTLIGFARDDRFVVYSHASRVQRPKD